MRTPSSLLALATAFAVLVPISAQAPHQGNGVGAAFIESGVATIGGNFDVTWGSPNAPNGVSVICSSDSFSPMNFPAIGTVCMDFLSPSFYFDYFALNAQGEASWSFAVPNTNSLVGQPPIFACAVACEASGFSVSKTIRIPYENPGAYRAVGSLQVPRALHTATLLAADGRDNDTRVLITGGGGGTVLTPLATDSTEIYQPLTRTYVTGPTMTVERTLHRAIRLDNGFVLVIGGADSLGVVTDTCELFDPTTNTLAATGTMTTPRAGHGATLLNDGRVFVSGGLADYVDPLNNFLAVMNTAQDTAEIYDPATGTWTAVAGTMATARSGQAQLLLPSGNVLITGGIQGAAPAVLTGLPVPVHTGSCTIFDTATGTLAPTGTLLSPRAFHGASVLQNGDVLVTGGSLSNTFTGTVNATGACELFTGATWTTVTALPVAVTNHVQVAAANGDALIFGGLTGNSPTLTPVADSGRHDGQTYTAGLPIGTNPGFPAATAQVLGAATASRLADRTWLLVGGSDAANALTTTFVFHE